MARALAVALLVALVASVGCVRPSALRVPTDASASDVAGSHPAPGTTVRVADEAADDADYDPWQPFNERVFAFNHDVLDRFVVKPAAEGWAWAVPEPARQGIGHIVDNFDMPRRVVNNLLQARPLGAGRELARFAINTTVGVAGLVDIARAIHIEPSDTGAADTLALYGVGAGPYLVLPSLPPLTVRDAVGRGVDALLDPLGYFVPFFIYPVRSILTAINERSVNLERFANVEDSVLDLYSAARNGYLQRRRHMLDRAIDDRRKEWAWAFRDGPADGAPPLTMMSSAAADNPT